MDRRAELEAALSIGQEMKDPWNIATALRNLGLLEHIQGNYPAARSLFEQSLEIWQQMSPQGRTWGAVTLEFLGEVALNEGHAERARALYEESAAILRGPGDMNFLAYSLRRLGQLEWREGNFGQAFALCKESLEMNREVNDPRGILACLAGFAAIAVGREDYETATMMAAAVEAQLAAFGIRLLYLDRLEYEHSLAKLRAHLDTKRLDRLWAKGHGMTLAQAIDFALSRPPARDILGATHGMTANLQRRQPLRTRPRTH